MIVARVPALAARLARPVRTWFPASISAVFLAGALSAQETATLVGRVSYVGGGLSGPGVQVVLPDLGLEATTNDKGRFRLSAVPPGRHEVVAQLLGCPLASKTVQFEPGTKAEVTFTLGARAIGLGELIVGGVASELSAAELPFAVDMLEGEHLRPESARSLGTLLQGRIAGGRVMQGSGLPGEEAQILLRGPTSILGSEQPLVVVDGVIAGHTTAAIDPMDVERVEVRKGAAAAALYGSRAQAGVIEITTKRTSARPVPQAQEALLIVNGAVTDGSLADLDIREIVDVQMLRGIAAALVAGPRGKAGVIAVTTRGGAAEGERSCTLPLVP